MPGPEATEEQVQHGGDRTEQGDTATGRAAPGVAKRELRAALLARRRALGAAEVAATGPTVAAHLLATEEVAAARTVAAYVSVGGEPATGPVLDALREAGKRVLLPVLLPDGDLDWAEHAGELRPATRGLLEPTGTRLGPDAVGRADVVLLPGLAVDARGVRLGRGGGSYDRAMARVSPTAFTCVLLHAGELLEHVPDEPHDRAVHAAVTPAGLVRFRAPA